MSEQVDVIRNQCPCGRPIEARICGASVEFYTSIGVGGHLQQIRRCPTCSHDFSQVTADQVKEAEWPG